MSSKRLYNREKFLAQTADDESVARVVVELFHKTLHVESELLLQAAAATNFEEIRRLCHKSKSTYIIIDCPQLFDSALHLETLAKNKDIRAIPELKNYLEMCRELDRQLQEDFITGNM